MADERYRIYGKGLGIQGRFRVKGEGFSRVYGLEFKV
jgi:hypothetical protein